MKRLVFVPNRVERVGDCRQSGNDVTVSVLPRPFIADIGIQLPTDVADLESPA